MTPKERQKLQEAYVEEVVDGMDHKTAYRILFDQLSTNMDDYTDEEFLTEVKEYYPHLLEEIND